MPIRVEHAPNPILVGLAGLAAGAGQFAERRRAEQLQRQQLEDQNRRFLEELNFRRQMAEFEAAQQQQAAELGRRYDWSRVHSLANVEREAQREQLAYRMMEGQQARMHDFAMGAYGHQWAMQRMQQAAQMEAASQQQEIQLRAGLQERLLSLQDQQAAFRAKQNLDTRIRGIAQWEQDGGDPKIARDMRLRAIMAADHEVQYALDLPNRTPLRDSLQMINDSQQEIQSAIAQAQELGAGFEIGLDARSGGISASMTYDPAVTSKLQAEEQRLRIDQQKFTAQQQQEQAKLAKIIADTEAQRKAIDRADRQESLRAIENEITSVENKLKEARSHRKDYERMQIEVVDDSGDTTRVYKYDSDQIDRILRIPELEAEERRLWGLRDNILRSSGLPTIDHPEPQPAAAPQPVINALPQPTGATPPLERMRDPKTGRIVIGYRDPNDPSMFIVVK